MADSIAKLAVVITGDASPLAREMRRAEVAVTGMERSTVKLSTALSAARGNWSAAFGVGGGGALAITAMAAGVNKLADAHERLLQNLKVDKLHTATGQWERLTEQIGILGTPFGEAKQGMFSGMADALEQLNGVLFPEMLAWVEKTKAAQAAAAQKAKEDAEAQKQAAKAAREKAEAAERAARAAERERDAMSEWQRGEFSRAQSIKDSVMTPAEELRRTFIELRSMLSSGFLDEETAIRAAKAAQDRFNATLPKRDIETRPGIAAAERFTTAGFSAAQSGMRELDKLEQLRKQQEADGKRAAQQRDVIIDVLRGQQPIEIIAGSP